MRPAVEGRDRAGVGSRGVPSDPDVAPGEVDDIVVDSWEQPTQPLWLFLPPWIKGQGLLTEPPEGRHGYAWVEPPDEANIDSDTRLLADTFAAYAWQQQERNARAEAEEAARRQQSERKLEGASRAIGAMLRHLPKFNAPYGTACLACNAVISPGQRVAAIPKQNGRWPYICAGCVKEHLGR